MYLFVKKGELPMFADGNTLRSPADPALAHRLSVEHSDEELKARFAESAVEFGRLHAKAIRTFGFLGVLASMTAFVAVMAGVLYVLHAAGAPPILILLGAFLGAAYIGACVQDAFTVIIERRSRDALVRAHSLRMAIELRKLRRWWEAYEAAGRPPLHLP